MTEAEFLGLWNTGVPLSLPLMERARSAMRGPHHELERGLCIA